MTNAQNSKHLNTVPPSITTLQTETRLPPQFLFVLEMPSLRVLRPREIKIQIFLQRLWLRSDCRESSCAYSCLSQPLLHSGQRGAGCPASRCSFLLQISATVFTQIYQLQPCLLGLLLPMKSFKKQTKTKQTKCENTRGLHSPKKVWDNINKQTEQKQTRRHREETGGCQRGRGWWTG